ncbi:EpsG family protein [Enterobacter ludwigii]|uniref:EpsG family protein n=1 Tax=Enterobacter ludwigii TaxID=299767 RepID=UPI0021F80624|nr:EpsG family protein [Enterobacter ludwigii]
MIFILFTGLSYTNGWDWYGYKDYYEYIQDNGFEAVNGYNEYGIEYLYLVYLYLIGLVGFGFGFFIFINSIIVNVLIYRACKKTAINYGLFMFIYLAASYIRLELSTIRQGLAVALIMMTYASLLNEKKKSALIYLILAIAMHRSAIIVLIFLPLITSVKTRNIHYLIVIFSLPFIFASSEINKLLLQLLGYVNTGFFAVYVSKLITYLSMNVQASVNPQALIVLLLYGIAIFYCDFRIKKQVLFLNIMACQVIISLYCTFLTQLIIMRVIYYFQIGWMCWLVILYKEYCKPKWLCFVLIVFTMTVKFSLNFRYEPDRLVFFPYYNVVSSLVDGNYGRSQAYILDKAEDLLQE